MVGMGFVDLNPVDRGQRRTQITHSFEQSVQRSLIDHRAGEERLAVLCQRDGQAAKPVCPLRTQMALEPDLLDHGLAWISCWVRIV